MKLYESHADAPEGEPILPDFFFVQSSSMNVNNSFITVQGNWGQVPTSKKSSLSARSFSITGSVESEKKEDVEKLRSLLFSKMFNKMLWLKVNDDDDRIFKVILDGQINITYHQGYNISRVFTLSFTLKAFEGVSYAEKRIKIDNIFDIKEKVFFDIDYKGDVSVIPDIKVILFLTDADKKVKNIVPFLIKNGKNIIKCATRKVKFNKDVKVRNEFNIVNGAPFANNEIIESIDGESLARPLILKPGANKIEFDPSVIEYNLADVYDNIPDDWLTLLRIEVSFRECFF